MAKCTFCGSNLEKGTGTMYVKKDGKILYFCSSKCGKNMTQLKRNPRKLKWTESYDRAEKGTKKKTSSEKSTKAKK